MLKTVTGKENSRKGYCMKKRVWGIVMAGLLLMGCQNMGNEQIQTNLSFHFNYRVTEERLLFGLPASG